VSSLRREVLHDTSLGMSGVFRPLQKGARGKLDVETKWGKAALRWRGPDQLGIGDQSLLFAVLEEAGEQLLLARDKAVATSADALWPLLAHQNDVFVADTVRITTTFSRLAIGSGWNDGGSSIERVRAGLRRMTETTVWVRIQTDNGEFLEGSSRLLGWQLSEGLMIVLLVNWRLGQALRGSQYSKISLHERYSLDGEIAQSLHALFSCKVNYASAWACHLDKLQVHIWGNAAEGGNLRARRSRMRKALEAIGKLHGWGVSFTANVARITRGTIRTKFGQSSNTPRRSVVSVTAEHCENLESSQRASSTEQKVRYDEFVPCVDVSKLFAKN